MKIRAVGAQVFHADGQLDRQMKVAFKILRTCSKTVRWEESLITVKKARRNSSYMFARPYIQYIHYLENRTTRDT